MISLALGLYQDIGVTETIPCSYNPALQCTAPKVDFVEGVAIIIAVVIVVLVGSINDWQKERQFRALNEKKEDRAVKVIRKGHEQLINIKVCNLPSTRFLCSFRQRMFWLVILQH